MSLLDINLYIPTLSSNLLLGVTKFFTGHIAQRDIHSLAPLPKRNAVPVPAKQSSERRGNKRKEGGLANEGMHMDLLDSSQR